MTNAIIKNIMDVIDYQVQQKLWFQTKESKNYNPFSEVKQRLLKKKEKAHFANIFIHSQKEKTIT